MDQVGNYVISFICILMKLYVVNGTPSIDASGAGHVLSAREIMPGLYTAGVAVPATTILWYIDRFNWLVQVNRERWVVSVMTVLWLLAVVVCFLSVVNVTRAMSHFSMCRCRLCWLNSGVISATVSICYVVPLTGSGMISDLPHVASMTSLPIRRHAQRHIQGVAHHLQGKGGSAH